MTASTAIHSAGQRAAGRMPNIGLGLYQIDRSAMAGVVAAAVERGYRLFDTASMYRNETAAGQALRSCGVDRAELFVTTKAWNDEQGRATVRDAALRSLERLGLDYLDLYMIHWPDPAQDRYVQTWETLLDLRREGIIRAAGVANFEPEHLDRLRHETGELPAVNQIEVHPQFPQRSLIGYHRSWGIATQAWSPLARGGAILTDPVITTIAAAHGCTAGQVILRWHLQRGVSVVPKSTSPQRLSENIDLFRFGLDDDEMAAIAGLASGLRTGPDPRTFPAAPTRQVECRTPPREAAAAGHRVTLPRKAIPTMKCTSYTRGRTTGRSKFAAALTVGVLSLSVLTACGDESSSSSSGGSGGSSEKGTCKPEDVTLVQSGRGLENEYYVSVDAGAKAFAAAKGLTGKYQWIASDGDSSKQLSQIKSILANGGECVVLNVDPNEASIVPSIVKEVDNAGAWLVTQWNTPEGLLPSADDPHWVAHMSVDGVPQGYETAKALFESMGGTGSIIALQGILDNAPAQQRFEGLKKALAEYPNIKLLEDQTAGWDRTKGQDVTQSLLTKYGDQITGVWGANDSMSLGAIAAINGAGKTGKIKVSGIDGLKEALDAVANPASGYVATTQSTAVAQGAYGLNIGFAAATGAIDPATEPAGHRAFYLKPQPVVTAANVASVGDPADTSKLDFSDVWAPVGEQVVQ